jgi:uncharacterized protein (DUF1015 family)
MIIKAFRGIRPAPEYAPHVAALPYDVMNRSEAKQMTEGNPFSFLHVDRAEIDLADDVHPYAERVYAQAALALTRMRGEGILIQDEDPALYLYRLTWAGRAQTGLVACVSIDEYLRGAIKKHELTREEKEQDRIRHVDACGAHTGPVFLTYRSRRSIHALVAGAPQRPLYRFTAEAGVGHEVWRLDDGRVLRQMEEAFAQVEAFYIADGHHRMFAAAQVGLQRRRRRPGYTGEEGFNFALAVIFPDDQLCIMAYNRLVRDLQGLTAGEFLHRVGEVAELERTDSVQGTHRLAMYLAGRWYILTIPGTDIPADPVEALDASLLQKRILAPILGIQDPRRDQRIDFVGGIRGLSELENRVDSGEMAVAFALSPVSMDELFQVSDAGEMMPPKSTWFEPKLRSGLLVHGLE